MNSLKKFKKWAKRDLWEDLEIKESEKENKKFLEMWGSGRDKLYLEYEKDQEDEVGNCLLTLMDRFDWSFYLEFNSLKELEKFSRIV